MIIKPFWEEINEKKKDKGYALYPFGEDKHI